MTNSLPKNKILCHYLKENPESASVILMNAGAKKVSNLFTKISGQNLLPSLILLPQSYLAESFTYIDNSVALPVMNLLPANVVAGIFRQWRSTDKEERVESLLKSIRVDHAMTIDTLLNYPIGTVGSLMNPVPLSVKATMTAREVLKLLQKKRNRYSRYIYVVDEKFSLQGVLPFKDTFYSEPYAIVSQLMTSSVFTFNPDLNAKKALENSSWKLWDSIPVADPNNRLLGVIRFDVLEDFVLGTKVYDSSHDEIQKAGAAVGEIFQIGINATISAMGIDERGRS